MLRFVRSAAREDCSGRGGALPPRPSSSAAAAAAARSASMVGLVMLEVGSSAVELGRWETQSWTRRLTRGLEIRLRVFLVEFWVVRMIRGPVSVVELGLPEMEGSGYGELER